MDSAYGIQPTVDHYYGCMVDLLGRAGRLEEAVELIAGMPMEPTPGVWGALFGACMIHKEYGLGEWVGNLLIRIQPHHSGRVHTSGKFTFNVSKLESSSSSQEKMKDNGVEKIRGCSWIELEGVIHEFIAFDKSHAQFESVYLVLDSLASQLEPENFVLHNGSPKKLFRVSMLLQESWWQQESWKLKTLKCSHGKK